MRVLAPAVLVTLISLAACGQGAEVNPPTEPAQPIGPVTEAEKATTIPRPGTGAPVFTGRWAAQASWCANTSATTDQVAIEITATEFNGYESRCTLAEVTEVGASWEAARRCEAEGERRIDRIRMTVVENTMTLDYLDSGASVSLVKCTTLAG